MSGLAAAVVFLTLWSTVSERSADYAVLRALGYGPGAILVDVLCQAALLGGAGAVIGTIAGSAIVVGVVSKVHPALGVWPEASVIGWLVAATLAVVLAGAAVPGLRGGLRRADDAHGTDDVSAPILLEARQLVVEYARGRRVLDGVGSRAWPESRVAIGGRAAAARGTLLAHLAGLRRPDGGEVRFEGRPLASRTSRELDRFRAGQLGFVFQRAALLPFLTVRENICLALGASGPGRSARARPGLDCY